MTASEGISTKCLGHTIGWMCLVNPVQESEFKEGTSVSIKLLSGKGCLA